MLGFRAWLVASSVLGTMAAACGGANDARIAEASSTDAAVAKDAGGLPAKDASSDAALDAGHTMVDAAPGNAQPDAGPLDAGSCHCLETLDWDLSDIAPCIFRASDGSTILYSSALTDGGRLDCGSVGVDGSAPNVPSPEWSESTFYADCAGTYTLCLTIKAGDIEAPEGSDCEVVRLCQQFAYVQARVEQQLPPLPSWVSMDEACAAEFDLRGGYSEMSVSGHADECGALDGTVAPFVFGRTAYCPPSCLQTPDTPECAHCAVGT